MESMYSKEAKTAYVMSRTKAERLPERAFRFLRTVGLYPPIMFQLAEAGYDDDHHRFAWERLHQISGYQEASLPHVSQEHRDAITALDRWDEPNFARTKAALRHRYPSQHDYIFNDLKAEQGAEAVLSVKTFLDRIDALEEGTDPKRKKRKAEDKKAVELLEQRGIISDSTRKHLRALIETAQTPAELPAGGPRNAKEEEAYKDALIELAMWFDEWSETARSVIQRRDYLISLGLAKRRRKKDMQTEEGQESDPEEPT